MDAGDSFKRLLAIGAAMSGERDLDRLLEMILLSAKELTGADGGTLFLVDGADRLAARYKIQDTSTASDEDLLAAIGRQRGGLLSGGRVNMQKAAEMAIHDFRSGAWGRISLETPDEFAQWLAAGQAKKGLPEITSL